MVILQLIKLEQCQFAECICYKIDTCYDIHEQQREYQNSVMCSDIRQGTHHNLISECWVGGAQRGPTIYALSSSLLHLEGSSNWEHSVGHT